MSDAQFLELLEAGSNEIRLGIDRDPGERDAAAVGCDLGIRDPLHPQDVVFTHGNVLVPGPDCRE